MESLKVRSRVTQWCPRRDCIGTAGQTDTIVGLVLARGREMPFSTKVELYGAHARQGKETVHLVGNRRELVGRQGRRPPALVMGVDLAAVVVRDSLNKDNDHGCSDRKLIKCLTGSADDLSSHWLVRTTSTWDYGVGPPRCGLVRKL